MASALRRNDQLQPAADRPPHGVKKQREEQDSTQILQCKICWEFRPPNMFTTGKICLHSICVDCIINYIQHRLNDKKSGIVMCPIKDCRYPLDPFQCKTIIGRNLFVQWCDLLCESAISHLERRHCPNKACGSLIMNECGGNVKMCECPSCRQRFCFKCGRVSHGSFWCSGEDRTLRWLAFRQGWQRCPSCGHYIERINGCPCMTCRCGTKFCYTCGKDFKYPCKCAEVELRSVECKDAIFKCLTALFRNRSDDVE